MNDVTDEQVQRYARLLNNAMRADAKRLMEIDQYELLKQFREWLDEQMPKRIT
jgi:hypothetical protein